MLKTPFEVGSLFTNIFFLISYEKQEVSWQDLDVKVSLTDVVVLPNAVHADALTVKGSACLDDILSVVDIPWPQVPQVSNH